METDISKDAVAAQRMDDQVNILCGANSAEATVLRAQSDRIAELETNNERLDAELYDINCRWRVLMGGMSLTALPLEWPSTIFRILGLRGQKLTSA